MQETQSLALLVISPIFDQVDVKKTLERRVSALMLKFGMVIRKRVFLAAVNSELAGKPIVTF
jgi:hypothetical protein